MGSNTYILYNPKTGKVTTINLPPLINSDDKKIDIDLDNDDDENNESDDDIDIDDIDKITTSSPSTTKTKRSISNSQLSTPSKGLKLEKNTSKYTTEFSSESNKHEDTAEEFLFKEREVTTINLPPLINSDDKETDIDLNNDEGKNNKSDDDIDIDDINRTTTSRPSTSYTKTKLSISNSQLSTSSKRLKLEKKTSKYTTEFSNLDDTTKEFLFKERSKCDQLKDTYILYNPRTRKVTVITLPPLINSDDKETDIDLDNADDENNESDDDIDIDKFDIDNNRKPINFAYQNQTINLKFSTVNIFKKIKTRKEHFQIYY
ncbi:hypothetical protein FQR65_LT14622 [Abscondita terminalis]|nr:hypothetical protein FQR65_LT14622 [Abscondita terminalis]